ncbi:hypothetical protein ACFE04_008220 [Oxalis oulophora]
MESFLLTIVFYSLPVCILFLVCKLGLWELAIPRRRLPPGPRPYPIVGNIFQLIGNKPHISLTQLAKQYGPIISLKLGSKTIVVISDPSIAKEALHQHEDAFTNRSILDAVRVLDHEKLSLVWCPVSSHWKNLRRICAMHLFTSHRLEATLGLRRQKTQELLDHISTSCETGKAVDISQVVLTTTLNFISNTMFSIDIAGYTNDFSYEFRKLVLNVMEAMGTPNLSDYFPALRFFDVQGVRKQLKRQIEQLFHVFDDIIKERSTKVEKKNDVLDALLDLTKEENSKLTLHAVKHLLFDFFVANTASSTVEWAMTELLRNPEKMNKAKKELDEILGRNGLVEESEISKLPYLQAVVKETFRLHPPVPLLVPREAGYDVQIAGFTIPKNAQLLVNVWGMGRDPRIWQDPTIFQPERFLECEIDFKGRDFELIPFGTGKRICPGLPLVHRAVHQTLASIINTFDWRLEDGLKPEAIDMDEKLGIALTKTIPLMAIPMYKP